MCKCLDEAKEKMIDKIKEGIGYHTDFKAEWENKMFFFGENTPKIPIVIKLGYSYRKVKVSGDPYKNKDHNTMSITMKYCPICGEKQ